MGLIQRCTIVSAAAVVVAAGLSAPASAYPGEWDNLMRDGGVVVDHQPRLGGGTAADTAFYDPYGYEVWQQLADDILLAEAAMIRRIVWWGFYHLNDPPPAVETMRIRFYDARPGDGLPGAILYEESFLNPSRTATGETVLADGLPDEYIFEVDLTTPLTLVAGTPYWFEALQIGDVDSTFLLEYSETDLTGIAFVNNIVADWQSALTVDLAFQLSTAPEPSSILMFVFLFGVLGRRERRCRGFGQR